MSFSSLFLSKSNRSLVYSILNKTIDERADKQLINYPELNIQDRLEGVMYKFSKKQDSRELAKLSTTEQRLTFMNKKVLEVCIPGFLGLVEQVEKQANAMPSDNSPASSQSDGDGDVNNVDINKQFEALENERKLEISSIQSPDNHNESQQFENKQDC